MKNLNAFSHRLIFWFSWRYTEKAGGRIRLFRLITIRSGNDRRCACWLPLKTLVLRTMICPPYGTIGQPDRWRSSNLKVNQSWALLSFHSKNISIFWLPLKRALRSAYAKAYKRMFQYVESENHYFGRYKNRKRRPPVSLSFIEQHWRILLKECIRENWCYFSWYHGKTELSIGSKPGFLWIAWWVFYFFLISLGRYWSCLRQRTAP